jgi:hypothetical protein
VNRIDPLVTKILDGYVPLPNAAANRVVRAPNLRDTGGQFGVRFDSKAGASHNVLARYILGRTRNVNPLGGSNFLPASNTATATLQDVTVSDTWVLRNNRINVLRISLNRIDAKPTSSSGVDPRSFGFAYSASDPASAGLPFVLVQGFFSTGDSQQQFASRTKHRVRDRGRRDLGDGRAHVEARRRAAPGSNQGVVHLRSQRGLHVQWSVLRQRRG